MRELDLLGAHLRRRVQAVQGEQVGAESRSNSSADGATIRNGSFAFLDDALAKVRACTYASASFAAGADPVWQWAGAFDGKRAWARGERAEGR